jgi:2-polyprenyl-6-methoxyphenol hydroxylase-like FAD-dependent oxidoreductase
VNLREYDIVVVGAGSEGAAIALLLAGAGASVTLLARDAGALLDEVVGEPGIDLRLGAVVSAIGLNGTVDLCWRDRTSTIAADLVVISAR